MFAYIDVCGVCVCVYVWVSVDSTTVMNITKDATEGPTVLIGDSFLNDTFTGEHSNAGLIEVYVPLFTHTHTHTYLCFQGI